MEESIVWSIFIVWVIFAIFLFWLIGFTEFSYFGNKGLRILYDIFAPIYTFKWFNPNYSSKEITEKLFIAPLKDFLSKDDSQFLDLACGTGRMSLMILSQEWFSGHIDSIDFSEGMLNKFRKELSKLDEPKRDKCSINKQNLLDWKAEANKYDAVTLMEVGEFLPNFVELIPDIAKTLKPNGVFMLTKPPDWMGAFYPGRKQTRKELLDLLTDNGFTDVEIHPWTHRYDVVIAVK